RLDGECVTFFEGRCSSLGQAVPYFPFITMLKLYFGLVPGDGVEAACTKVAAKLGTWSPEKAEREYPALSRLLGLRSAGAGEPASEELKRETFDAVARLLLGQSQQAPVVVMLEDLHWIDDASRELLETLVARIASAPVMVVVTHRPDDRAAWRTRAALTQRVLRRPPDGDVRGEPPAGAAGPVAGPSATSWRASSTAGASTSSASWPSSRAAASSTGKACWRATSTASARA